MISASQKRQMSSDNRFTPKSIAQRAFTSAPKSSETTVTGKKQSPPGVINFIHGQPQQVTTFTSGGYIIGRLASGSECSSSLAEASIGSVLQQKRKNLKLTLNTMKAPNTGQMSLLKVAQKSQLQLLSEQSTDDDDGDIQSEELPDKIIIAAAKNKEKQQNAVSLQDFAVDQKQVGVLQEFFHPQESKSSIPDDILLGKVIKDTDLLKLILKALKWPVSKHNMDLQIARLKNSKFGEIMADPNLLLDTDLTQILGPYLAPVFLTAHALQQQQMTATASLGQLYPAPSTTLNSNIQTAGLTSTIPYKLPAETSVQLVPASPPSEDDIQKPILSQQSFKGDLAIIPKLLSAKKMRRSNLKERNDSDSIKTIARKSPQFQLNLDLTQLSPSISGDNADNVLLALLQRQRAAMHRLQRVHRRKRSEAGIAPATNYDLGFDDNEIILMEDIVPKPVDPTISSLISTPISDYQANSFPVPQDVPLITRPIIKRRKTVIQTSPAQKNLNVNRNDYSLNDNSNVLDLKHAKTSRKSSMSLAVSPNSNKYLPPMPPLQRKPSEVAPVDSTVRNTVMHSTTIPLVTQDPVNTNDAYVNAKSINTSAVSSGSIAATITPSASTSGEAHSIKTCMRKSTCSKSALGQQLLEAIGLQKLVGNSSSKRNTTDVEANSRESVQQIRSALKKSLKQAQEQQLLQLRKQEEPIIQDADSTTKSLVKEVVVEAKDKNVVAACTTVLDVEDQIDKNTVVVENRSEFKSTLKQEKKKIYHFSKIPEIKRRFGSFNRYRKHFVSSTPNQVKIHNTASEPQTTEMKEINIKLNEKHKMNLKTNIGKEDIDGYNDICRATSLSNPRNCITSTETNLFDHITPRKRGRKRKEQQANKDYEPEECVETSVEHQRGRSENMRSRSAVNLSKDLVSGLEREREIDVASLKNDAVKASASSKLARPTRVSKALSKYYKGPDKVATLRRSMPTRITRNRN